MTEPRREHDRGGRLDYRRLGVSGNIRQAFDTIIVAENTLLQYSLS